MLRIKSFYEKLFQEISEFFLKANKGNENCTRNVRKKYAQYKLNISVKLINFDQNSETYKIRQDDDAQEFL